MPCYPTMQFLVAIFSLIRADTLDRRISLVLLCSIDTAVSAVSDDLFLLKAATDPVAMETVEPGTTRAGRGKPIGQALTDAGTA